ncbi:hypothetical protein PFISCL1PPCAC_4139, partial [Pristionchus fissidentatus]
FRYSLDEAHKIEDDFVEVECLGYNNFHGRVRRKELQLRSNMSSPDIFIIRVRSLNSDIFLPQTTRYLENALGAVRFVNYQSMGDEYADFAAITTGALSVPLSRERMGSQPELATAPRSFYDDPCILPRSESFVPRLMQKLGYATFIVDENAVEESSFEEGCGWEPTSHYRPILHRFKPIPGCNFARGAIDYFHQFVDVY